MENITRDRLRQLVDTLPDDLVGPAISALTHLEDNEPLGDDELSNLESAEADRRAGHMTSLEDYERHRGL